MVPIRNDGPRLKLAGNVTLQPGLNQVAEAAWRECLKNKMTRVFLDTHIIQAVAAAACEPLKKPTSAAPVELEPCVVGEPMLAKDLIAVIKESKDLDYLWGLRDGERRSTVVIAIQARLELLRKLADAEDGEG